MANEDPLPPGDYAKLLANARAAVAAKANEIMKRNASEPTPALQAKVAAKFGNQQKQMDRILLDAVLQKFRMNKKHPELPPIAGPQNRNFVEEHLNLLHDPTELAETGINYNNANQKHKLKPKILWLKHILQRLKQAKNSGQANTRPSDIIMDEEIFILEYVDFLKPELEELKQKMYDATNDLFDEREKENPAKLELLEEKRTAAVKEYNDLNDLYKIGIKIRIKMRRQFIHEFNNERARTRKARKQRKMSLKKRS
jgi:hypothetical protein